jgi:hypothetical protein
MYFLAFYIALLRSSLFLQFGSKRFTTLVNFFLEIVCFGVGHMYYLNLDGGIGSCFFILHLYRSIRFNVCNILYSLFFSAAIFS